jgi:hypothetical protein
MIEFTHRRYSGVRIYHSNDVIAYEKGLNELSKTIHSSTSRQEELKKFYLDIIIKEINKLANNVKIRLEDSLGNSKNLFMEISKNKKDFIFSVKDRKPFDFFGISKNQEITYPNEIKMYYSFPNHKIQEAYFSQAGVILGALEHSS